MLTSLRLQKFKTWYDTGTLKLAPLTVFFGTNSAGKSSVGQFLLMLKQTAESPDRARVLHPGGDEKSPIDLGSFKELIFGHDTTQKLEFDIGWSLPEGLKVDNPLIPDEAFKGENVSFSCAIAEKGKKLRCEWLKYTLSSANRNVTVQMQPDQTKPNKYELTAEGYSLTRIRGRAWQLPGIVRFYGFPDETKAYFQNAALVDDLALSMERELGRLVYLGPLREYPKRTYTWTGEEPQGVGYRGEDAVIAALAASDRKLSRGRRTQYKPFQQFVAQWLVKLGVIREFKLAPISRGRREYEVLVKTGARTADVKLPDVGFGVSQVLPVVIQCFYASPDSTVIMEQPEIHLHPSVQSQLADLFVETIQSRQDGDPRRIQLIIESHSEHFLRRLQYLIAENKVGPDDVAVYFCKQEGDRSKLELLQLDMFGNIANWPENFFGDQMADVAGRQLAEMHRREDA